MADARLRDSLGEAARVSVRRYAPDAIIDRWERQFALVGEEREAASLGV
jgi:hypothetical protein